MRPRGFRPSSPLASRGPPVFPTDRAGDGHSSTVSVYPGRSLGRRAGLMKRRLGHSHSAYRDLTRVLAAARSEPAPVRTADSGIRRPRTTSLHRLVGDCVQTMRRLVGSGVAFDLRAARDSVEGDPAELEQALLDVCLCACDCTPEGATLTLGSAGGIRLPSRRRPPRRSVRPGCERAASGTRDRVPLRRHPRGSKHASVGDHRVSLLALRRVPVTPYFPAMKTARACHSPFATFADWPKGRTWDD